jgi:hypothetical protein
MSNTELNKKVFVATLGTGLSSDVSDKTSKIMLIVLANDYSSVAKALEAGYTDPATGLHYDKVLGIMLHGWPVLYA